MNPSTLDSLLSDAQSFYPIEKVALDANVVAKINAQLISQNADQRTRLSDFLNFYGGKRNTGAVLKEKAQVLAIFIPHIAMNYLKWLIQEMGVEAKFETIITIHFHLIALAMVVLENEVAAKQRASKNYQINFRDVLHKKILERVLLGFNTREARNKWQKAFKTVWASTRQLVETENAAESKGLSLEQTALWQLSAQLNSIVDSRWVTQDTYLRLAVISRCFAEKMRFAEWL